MAQSVNVRKCNFAQKIFYFKSIFLKLMNVGVLTSPVARKAFIPNLTVNKHKQAPPPKEYVYF